MPLRVSCISDGDSGFLPVRGGGGGIGEQRVSEVATANSGNSKLLVGVCGEGREIKLVRGLGLDCEKP